MMRPEIQFLYRVWLPCLLHYKTTPSLLFRRARQGRIDAIEDLVRLDKSVLGDRIIGEHWHRAAQAKSKGRFRKMQQAVAGFPRGHLTAKKVKRSLAGFAVQVSRIFAKAIGPVLMPKLGITKRIELREPDIRKLFDILARIRGGGELRDRVLPAGSEALAKVLSRSRTEWAGYLPDKNRS